MDIPPVEHNDKLTKLNLTAPRYLNRLPPSKIGYAPKTIHNPRKCISVQNHWCQIKTLEVFPPSSLKVPTQKALSHHYKMCHFKGDCEKMIATAQRDDIMTVYGEELSKRYEDTMRQLQSTSSS